MEIAQIKNMEDIAMKEKVIEILAGINPMIKDGINLISEGIVDSFAVVNIVMELEEAFEIEIDPEDVIAENFENVDKIAALVEKTKQNA